MNRLRKEATRKGVAPGSALPAAVEELGHTLEELSVALEQLEVANEELADARHAAEQYALRYRDLFQSVPDAYLATDGWGVIREANRAAEQKFGREARYLAGKPLGIFVAKEEREAFDKCLLTLRRARGAIAVGWEPRFAPRGVDPFQSAISVATVHEPGGGVAEIRWLLRDVTQRRRAEAGLRASEARMRLMADSLPVRISYVDRQQRYQFVNSAFEQWYGISREKVLGQHVRDVLGKAAYVRLRPQIERVLAGDGVQFDVEEERAGTGARDVRYVFAPHLGEAGEAVGFYALVSDVTALKAAEREARESEARTRIVVDSALDGIVVLDDRRRIASANPAACALFGYAREEIVGCAAERLIPGADARNGYLAHPTEPGSARARELVARRKDGSEFPVQVLVAEARDRDAPIFVALLRDLSEQRRMEEQLRAAAAGGGRAGGRERRRLAADLHDDLGELLSLAAMRLGALRDATVDPRVGEEIRTIERLVAQAHDHAESLTFQLSPPILHDRGFVPAAEWLAESLGRSYDLSVQIDDDGTPKPLDEACRVALFRALRELLINVARHSGSREARVRIWRGTDGVGLEVRDHGLGFDPAAAKDGFGLVSVRERLRNLGGDLEIHSAPGEGARVVAQVPSEGRKRR
jgi:PAS domain S-box-containing protein